MTLSILTSLLLLAPVVTESGRFTIRQEGRVIGTEEFTIQARDKGYVVDGKTRLQADSANLTSHMELDENLNVLTYEYSNGKGTIRVRVDKDSSELKITENKQESETNFRFPPGASIVDNNFFHHYLILLYRVKGADESFPIFVPQDMQVGLARVRSTASRQYSLDVGAVKIEATVDEKGRLLRLSVPAAKVVVER